MRGDVSRTEQDCHGANRYSSSPPRVILPCSGKRPRCSIDLIEIRNKINLPTELFDYRPSWALVSEAERRMRTTTMTMSCKYRECAKFVINSQLPVRCAHASVAFIPPSHDAVGQSGLIPKLPSTLTAVRRYSFYFPDRLPIKTNRIPRPW